MKTASAEECRKIRVAVKILGYATITLGLITFAFGGSVWGLILVLVGVVFSRVV